MCKETKEELKKGEKLAKEFLKHLERMGAAECKIPLMGTKGIKYWIEVKQADDSEYTSKEALTKAHIALGD